MSEKSRLKPLFENRKPLQAASNEGKAEVEVTPELEEKIKNLFIALEEAILEAFPDSRYVSQVLTFLEIAAMYALRLLVK